MGRAIVRDPSAFLMDEPLSNLDAKLRVRMRAEVARIQRRLGVATLYVTHDQVEAMTMGDRVAVIQRRGAPAVRQPTGPLRQPEEPVRGGLHGLSGDEPVRGHDGRGGGLCHGRQPEDRAVRRRFIAAKPGLRAYANRPSWWGSGPRTSRSTRATSLGESELDSRQCREARERRCSRATSTSSKRSAAELLIHFTTDAHLVELGLAKARGCSRSSPKVRSPEVARAWPASMRGLRWWPEHRVRFHLDPVRMHFFDATTREAIVK